MSETIIVIESITPQVAVEFSSDQGPQGGQGVTGPTGATGATGPWRGWVLAFDAEVLSAAGATRLSSAARYWGHLSRFAAMLIWIGDRACSGMPASTLLQWT